MTCRDPKGHFCDRGGMMAAWLPLMLSWVYGERGLMDMLAIATRFCETQCARCLSRNAEIINQFPTAIDKSMDFWGPRGAESWSKRRDVLREALAKLKEIK